VLDEENNSIILGRSSKSQSKGCVAAKDNGWYNSAVMSREHAEIMADMENKVSLAPFEAWKDTLLAGTRC
jgi:hypothetical protein